MSTLPPAHQASRYLVLHLGVTRLLLNPTDVRDIEAAEQVITVDAPLGASGRIDINGQPWKVFDFSPDFELRVGAPMAGRLCVLLQHDTDPMVVVCEKVEMLEVTECLQPLPPAMRLPSSPIDALALQPEGLVCQSSADRLITCVKDRVRAMEAAETQGVSL